jgi:Cu+-exporting ATPase
MSEQRHHPPMRLAEEDDPVCGMKVDPAKAAASIEYDGATFYFCSQGCAAKFRATPEKYEQNNSDGASSHAATKTQPQRKYTCPMHPQIVRDGPGSCPICGMALEPREVTPEGSNPELANMTRRLWISVALAVPMLALMVSGFIPPMPMQHMFSARAWAWIEFALATPVVLWCGLPFFVRGWQSILHRSLNMFTLISLGTGSAYLYSVFATVVPQIFPASFRGGGGQIDVYFEPASVIVALVLLGQVLELRARSQTVRFARCLAWLRSRRSGLTTRAAKLTFHSNRCKSATGFAYGPAKKCRWMAPCLKVTVPSMNR